MRLSALLSDGMVLQRGKNTSIWGETKPEQKVIITFLGEIYETFSDSFGKFSIKLNPLEAGGPFEMVFDDGEIHKIKDVLIGDVWLLNGQSNMELPIRRTLDLYEDEIKDAHESNIRKFSVPMQYEFHEPKQEVVRGEWQCVTPEQVLDFSATGYFFAKELYERYGVPIGLLQTAVGGTPIEAWLSEETIKSIGGYEEELELSKDEAYVKNTLKMQDELYGNWFRQLNETDPGLIGTWFQNEDTKAQWRSITLPCYLEEEKFKDSYGSIWFRKDIYLSHEQAKKNAKLVLGTIVDADDTYINGELVGSTAYRYPPRRYKIQNGLLKEGNNVITVRLIRTHNVGGFIPDMPYQLILEDEVIDLTGEWNYCFGSNMDMMKQAIMFQYKPTGVYNGMLYPIRNYSIKGLAFYQGESNTGKPKGYGNLFQAYIKGIRSLFQNDNLPVVYVQLPNFFDKGKSETSNCFAELREEQRSALQLEGTAMVVTIDIGEYNELHPQNKKSVGQRIALAARNIAYGEEISYSGPMFESMSIVNNKIYVKFQNAEKGFLENELKGFEISEDGIQFIPAKAEIDQLQIVVFSEKISHPKHVRYAWADNPEYVSLYGSNGLPAVPFNTTIYCGI